MTIHDQQRNQHEPIERLLKQSLPPTGNQPGAELPRDLWPAMLQRLGEHSFAVPWFDWGLLAALVVWIALFPRAILVLLYHL
jgi:hypothetical protein